MKTFHDLVEDAQKIATHVAIAKKLASDLATNVKLSKDVLSADNVATIRSIYSEEDMLKTSSELDAAIDEAMQTEG